MKTLAVPTTPFAVALLTGLLFLVQPGCGGANAGDGTTTPGQSHSNAGDDVGDDIDTTDIDSSTPATANTPTAVDTSTAAPVTFVLKNSGSDELFINMDKGWQAVIFAYSGQVPNAKSMLMFPTHCTASCDSAPEELCPVCPEPERVKEIRAAENHDAVAPGDSRSVPWDGMAFSYQKAKKGKRGCKCYTTVTPEPETYTVKACGLRKTKSAKARSKYQCVEGTMTLPSSEPIVVELDFADSE